MNISFWSWRKREQKREEEEEKEEEKRRKKEERRRSQVWNLSMVLYGYMFWVVWNYDYLYGN